MPSFTSLAAALAFVASVTAQDPNFDSINTPLKGAQIQAGQPFTITWSLLSATTPTGPATITLIGGDSQKNLAPIATIGHVQNEDLKFVWSVDASLGAQPLYGLNLTLDADTSHFQYSNPFQIVGGAAASGTPSSSGSETAPTSSSATGTGSTSGTATATTTTSDSKTTSAASTTGGSGDGTTTSANTAPTTTAAAPTHASNSTTNSTSPTSSANKTTPATKPTTTSGATGLSGLSAVGALAVALAASAAMHWGL